MMATIMTGYWGYTEHQRLVENQSLGRQAGATVNLTAGSTIKRYIARPMQPSSVTQPGSALLEILDAKLSELEISHAVRDIQPQTPRMLNSLRIEELRVRISPVPATRLSELFDKLESHEPILRVDRYEITRLEKESDELDVVLFLQQWREG